MTERRSACRSTTRPQRRSRHRRRSSSTSPACTRAPASSAPDFLAVVDAEDGRDRPRAADAERRRRAAPLRLEPLLVGLSRARSLAPDRPRLPLLADPRRSTWPTTRAGRRIEKVIEPEEVVARDGLHAAAHGALHAWRQRRHLDAWRRRRQRRRRLRSARCEDVRAQGPLGERRRDAALQLRLLVPAAQERARSRRSSASRTPTSPASTSRTSPAGRYGSRLHFWNLGERTSRADGRPRRERASSRSRRAGSTTPTPRRASSAPRSRARCGTSTGQRQLAGRPGDRRRERRARGLAVPRAGADHRPRALDGRPLSLLRRTGCTATCASTTSRTPPSPKLTGQALARRRARQADRRAARAERRPATCSSSRYDGRRLYVTNSLYSTWDNQFYPGAALLAPAGRTATRTAAWRSTTTSSSTSTTGPTGRPAPTRCGSRAAIARRRSSSDRRTRHGHPGRGDDPAARVCGGRRERSTARGGRRLARRRLRQRLDGERDWRCRRRRAAARAAEEALLDAAERLLVDVGYAGITTRRARRGGRGQPRPRPLLLRLDGEPARAACSSASPSG